jgi:HD-GYP domain-containing protein (c-di-GMP phosphodiesterase class II)
MYPHRYSEMMLGPLSEPGEDLWYVVRRLADDRPLPERGRLVARALVGGATRVARVAADICEAGTLLARRLHMPTGVALALGQLMERWDGKGVPGAAAGEEISRALRIVRIAHDLVAVVDAGGRDAAMAALTRRRGRGYDPAIADAALADAEAVLRAADVPDPWERVLDAEPAPVATISGAGLPSVARAFAEFTDVKAGFLHGHCTRVAELAATGAAALGGSAVEVAGVRAAGLLHDVGRVAVPNGIWEKPGTLSAGDWERVRLHPYYTDRVLARSGALAPLAGTAGSHHERLDGSGYHRGATAAHLDVGARPTRSTP